VVMFDLVFYSNKVWHSIPAFFGGAQVDDLKPAGLITVFSDTGMSLSDTLSGTRSFAVEYSSIVEFIIPLDTIYRSFRRRVIPGMGSRQFCQGRGSGQGREVEAEARQTKFEARPRRGRVKSTLFVSFWYHAQCTCSSYVFLLCGQ